MLPTPESQLAPGTATLTTLAQAVVESSVPSVLVAPLRRALAVDVADVTVRRGAEVSLVAQRMGARGFTRAGVAHVPESAGDLDGAAAPLLAHELTHVAQQRRFGAALPGPETVAGRQLEEEAVAVEQWVANGVQAAPPEVQGHLERPRPDTQRRERFLAGLVDSAAGRELPTRDVSWLAHALPPGVTTADVTNAPGADELPELRHDWFLDKFLTDTEGVDFDAPPPATGQRRRPRPEPGEEREDTDGPGFDEIDDHLAEHPPLRWMDLDDQDHFEELADRLYNTLIGRLRFDVLVERERTGTLLDFG